MKVRRFILLIILSIPVIWGNSAISGPFKESSASASTSTIEANKQYEDEATDEIAIDPRPNQLIRFHVLANSDSEQDQKLKRAVRDAILKEVSPQLAVSRSLDESRTILKQLSPEMENIGRLVVTDWGKDYSVHTEYGHFSFPTKSYGSLVLPAGDYEALRIVIGEGKGSNWWCVLFPPLCFIDIEQSTAVPVDGKLGIPLKSKNSVGSKGQISKQANPSKPKVRFFFWEMIKLL